MRKAYLVFIIICQLLVIPIGIFAIFHGPTVERWVVAILFAVLLILGALDDLIRLLEQMYSESEGGAQ